MEKPVYKRQANNQIAVINMSPIIKDIREFYPRETFETMAVRIGVSAGTIKTWYKTGRARQKVADALIMAYPIFPTGGSVESADNSVDNQILTLTELFEQVFRGLTEIRKRLGA
jgi:hypothetical protein